MKLLPPLTDRHVATKKLNEAKEITNKSDNTADCQKNSILRNHVTKINKTKNKLCINGTKINDIKNESSIFGVL